MSFGRFRENGAPAKTRRNEARPLRAILVTGGCGFIGSNFINHFAKAHPEVHVYNVDKLDYCANEKSVEVRTASNYTLIRGDICNTDLIMHILNTHNIDTILNFAAQSHVDNSFGNSMTFTRTNVLGTHNLLECARVYGKIEKFIHVSTDEVYGEVDASQGEEAVLNPTNPYAATKAAAEFIVKSYAMSFHLPCVITRGNNVYGPYQYPEKVIPRFTMLLHSGEKMTIQGNGANARTFIHAFDVAKAFTLVVEKGILGEIYNIGTRDEYSVKDIATRLAKIIKPNEPVDNLVTYIPDRDFNDQRYDINSTKLQELGWRQEINFEEGLLQTVKWYTEVALPNGFWPIINKKINTALVSYPMIADSA
jgi:dTDP-glucose 4,6-dehydratase